MQGNITAVGTIASGTWAGTAIGTSFISTGTSGAAIPLLSTVNTWATTQIIPTISFGASLSKITSNGVNGNFQLTNAAGSGFGTMFLGPTTGSYVAFQSNSGNLNIIRGDLSGTATVSALEFNAQAGGKVSAPAFESNGNYGSTGSGTCIITRVDNGIVTGLSGC